MNYQLIHHPEPLQKFIDFLPELKTNEGYLLILLARKKWHPESGIPSVHKMKRETVNDKSKIISVIRQWETAQGTYNSGDKPIDQKNLGVYISFNPKDQYRACFELITKCLDHIRSNRQNINVKSVANDAIQISNGTKNFIDIDVDIKEDENYLEIIKFIKTVIPAENLTFIKTHGGFHCLVRLNNLSDTWYNQIKSHTFKSEINIMSNDLVPLVGCSQGDFVPYFMNG